MESVFRVPDLGEGLHEVEIVSWHVGVGDHVVTDQPLVSVETDKALVDIPSPHSGHIAALHGKPGDIVAVGAPLVEFTVPGVVDTGALVGELERVPPPAAAKVGVAAGHVKAAPAVRRLAAERGVDLAAVKGTGVGGTITQADVEAAAAGRETVREPIRGVRRAMLRNMTRAGREVVPASLTDEADIAAWPDGGDMTVRLIRALAVGCKASPGLNAWFDAATETRTLHARVDVGIAVETEDGLFAPVIRDAGRRSAAALRSALETIKSETARRSIAPERLVRQTITLSNFGMVGGRHADLVIVPPQVAILGAGRAEARPAVVEDRVVAHRVVPLSLTFDHRVVTGMEAARFLSAVIEDLEKAA
jgi:pyruvate dehydrogenase E2 component (dihydrolipoamide acetyltransferase)